MAAPVAHFIPSEIRAIYSPGQLRFLACLRHRTLVAVFRMEAVVDMPMKIGGAVKPRAGADKQAIVKPLRPIVAGRGAGVGRDIVVTIRTIGRYSNVNAYLSLCCLNAGRQADANGSRYNSPRYFPK